MDLIISHTNADFDSLAAMVAAKKLYPGAELCFSGSADTGVREFLAIHGDWLQVLSPREVDLTQVRRLIVVDTREATRLGDFREIVERPDVEVHVYDHHPTSYKDLVGDRNIVKPVGSTTTILVDLIRQQDLPITPHEATLFCAGIYVDTGSLAFPTTTVEDVKAAAWLLEQGASLRMVGDYLNHSLSTEQRQLLTTLLSSAKRVEVHGHQILLARASLDHYVDELALLTHRIIDLERVPAAFSLVRMGERIYVVGRSTSPAIDVSEIVGELGGGGHPTAASASLKGTDVGRAEADLLRILQARVRPSLTAGDVMHVPVWSVSPSQTIERAHREMVRYGNTSLLVMQDGEIQGMISRRDVDKALQHGYGHAPVRAYMSRHLAVATPGSPLSEVQRLMMAYDLGRVPVVEEGKVVGIVTRGDLLKAMSDQEFQKPVLASTLRVEDWSPVPPFVLDLLKGAGEAGKELGLSVFAVGGLVRDLFLGVENLDLDLVVEGEGLRFARLLGERLSAHVRCHEKFQTAVLVLPDGFKIDVATARAEFYARPAALPEVVGTSIKQDLFRRDFSVNAMAIKLNPPDFGKLIDFFGGQRDLQHGVVRVLHNLSFVDDPTRIFRAIRFEQRYHFRMDSHTEKLVVQAIRGGEIGNLSMERVSAELELILSETNPVPAIRRMAGLRILPLLHPSLKLTNKGLGVLEGIPEVLKHFEGLLGMERPSPWILYGIALFSELLPHEVAEISNRLRWTGLEKGKLSVLRSDWKRCVRDLGRVREMSGSEIAEMLEPFSLEELLFLYASAGSAIARERIRDHMARLRKVMTVLSGEDLQRLGLTPGPLYRKLLKKVREAQLDERIRSKEEALEFLRKEVEHHGEAPSHERNEAHRKTSHRSSSRRP